MCVRCYLPPTPDQPYQQSPAIDNASDLLNSSNNEPSDSKSQSLSVPTFSTVHSPPRFSGAYLPRFCASCSKCCNRNSTILLPGYLPSCADHTRDTYVRISQHPPKSVRQCPDRGLFHVISQDEIASVDLFSRHICTRFSSTSTIQKARTRRNDTIPTCLRIPVCETAERRWKYLHLRRRAKEEAAAPRMAVSESWMCCG
jgi:hypothetical protein